MKIGNLLVSLVIGYFVIGGLIGLTQLGLSKLFEPPCNGTVVHRLWADFPKRLDDSEILHNTLIGKKNEPFIPGLVRSVARWLPDLYHEVVTGDMAVRDYLLGGYQCVPAKPLQIPPGFGFLGSQNQLPKSMTPILEITKGLPPRQGSLADALVKESGKDRGRAADETLVTIEPFAGVTLELPGDWLMFDKTAIQQGMTERNQTWAFPVLEVNAFVPPGQVDNVSIFVISTPPMLPGKELQNLHNPEVREIVDRMIKKYREKLENEGSTTGVFTEPSEERVEKWAGFGFTVQMVSQSGAAFETKCTVIQTSTRTIVFTLVENKAISFKFGETLKHARESLKVTY